MDEKFRKNLSKRYDTVYHDFKIGDIVYLQHMGTFFEIKTEEHVHTANTTSHRGIRIATPDEIDKFLEGREF